MTNYNLEEFKQWLEEKPERKKDLSWGIFFMKYDTDKSFTSFAKAETELDRGNFFEPSRDGRFLAASWKPHWEIVRIFVAEREREREGGGQSQTEEGGDNMPRSQYCSTCQQETQHWWGTGNDNHWYCDQCTEYGRNLTANDPQREQQERNNTMINAQDWLNQNFPTPESKNQVLHIEIDLLGNGERNSSETRPLSTANPEVCHWFNAYLEGELNLSLFRNPVEIKGLEHLTNLKTIKTYFCCTKMFGFLEEWKQEIQAAREQVQNNQQLLAQIQEKEQSITSLQEQISQEQTDKSQFQQQVQQLGQEVAGLRQEIERHLARIQSLESQLATKTNELNQELTKTLQLQQSLSDLQAQKQTSEADLQAQLKAKEKQLKTLREQGTTSTAQLRKEIEDLKQQLAANQQAYQALRDKTSDILYPEAQIPSRALEDGHLISQAREVMAKLKQTQQRLTQQITQNQEKGQSIEQLQANLAHSEKALQETRLQLTQSQSQITHLETKILNHEQLKEKYEQNIEELTQTLNQTQQELARAQEKERELAQEKEETNQELSQTKETLQTKQEQLRKTRLEIASLQAQLKKVPKPEPNKPVFRKSEPINPWLLATLAVVVIGSLWLFTKKGGKT